MYPSRWEFRQQSNMLGQSRDVPFLIWRFLSLIKIFVYKKNDFEKNVKKFLERMVATR